MMFGCVDRDLAQALDRDAVADDRLLGDHVGRAPAAVEERHLAEGEARADAGDPPHPLAGDRQRDADRAARQHEEHPRRVALAQDDLALVEAHRLDDRLEEPVLLAAQPREDLEPRQRELVEVGALGEPGQDPVLAPLQRGVDVGLDAHRGPSTRAADRVAQAGERTAEPRQQQGPPGPGGGGAHPPHELVRRRVGLIDPAEVDDDELDRGVEVLDAADQPFGGAEVERALQLEDQRPPALRASSSATSASARRRFEAMASPRSSRRITAPTLGRLVKTWSPKAREISRQARTAADAVAVAVERRREDPDPDLPRDHRDQRAGDAALGRHAGVEGPLAGVVVHAAARHHRQDVAHLDGPEHAPRRSAGSIPSFASVAAITARSRRRHPHRALGEVEVEDLVGGVPHHAGVQHHVGDRAVAVAGRLSEARTASSTSSVPPGEAVEDREHVLAAAPRACRRAASEAMAMAPELTIGLNGRLLLDVEDDRVERLAGRLDADVPQHALGAAGRRGRSRT